ncbi:response regulator [Sanyastnella coralliicola]|uniref:response regulator n=1 Tax=Sanyastnella coralliicola TaxID=3069118 RepID=UPI0027B90C11|nr:response regulator transcription factor [Longitalea sp. SCSIO 12813]
MKQKKILIVDDHHIILDGLKSLFAGMPEYDVIGYVDNAEEALRFIESVTIDLLITDIEMPGKNGVWLIEKVRKSHPELKIVVLTMHHERPFIQSIMNLGVHGCLLKTASEIELKNAIEKVATEASAVFPSSSQLTERKGASIKDVQLTERELQTLELITEGLSTKEIANKLHLSSRTVEKHRASLMLKTSAKNVAGLIRFAFENNLV